MTSGVYIPSTVAQALGIALASEGDPVENLVRVLKDKRTLLVFDNCEHLLEPVARVLAALLHGCPGVKVLASSRQGLGVEGEETYRLPSLEGSAAVALFVDRAVSVDKKFALTEENAPIVADICTRLDGIPLAIELASARMKMLTPRQLREWLDERFHVLTGGSRDVLPRHQTLRALIDWSHDLLDERERELFRRLGIFVNGFTLDGAVAVGSDEHRDELDVFDGLASLVEKSLVLTEPQGDVVRYRLLESTRAYALEKLNAAGARDLIACRHLRFFRDRFVELWERCERTARLGDLDAALQTELGDVRSALDGALARSQVIDGSELLANIHKSWGAIGLEAEGMNWCEAYLAALPADQARLRARLSSTFASLLSDSQEHVRAFAMATEAVEHARASGDPSSLSWALREYARMAVFLLRLDDAAAALAEVDTIPGTSANVRISLLQTRARFSKARGDLETSFRMFEQFRKEHRSLGNTGKEQVAALEIAEVEHERGHTQEAIAIVRETLPRARSGVDKSTLGSLLNDLAGYLVAVGDLPGAVAAAREAVKICAARELEPAKIAIALEHLALVFALYGDWARAATLEGYANAAFGDRFEREFAERTTHDRLTALLREGLAADELARLVAEGTSLTREAAIALALEENEAT